jgi:hypothetical protein
MARKSRVNRVVEVVKVATTKERSWATEFKIKEEVTIRNDPRVLGNKRMGLIGQTGIVCYINKGSNSVGVQIGGGVQPLPPCVLI